MEINPRPGLHYCAKCQCYMWSVILCKCSGMETLNCFVHIYQFYISSWKLNLLLPESSKIQAVALSAQGEHMPATLSNISCLHWRFISSCYVTKDDAGLVIVCCLICLFLKSFHNHAEGPYSFEPGEGYSRGLLRECEIFARVRWELWWQGVRWQYPLSSLLVGTCDVKIN